MRATWGVIKKDLKSFFRSKTTLFWTIAFPIIIMLLFSVTFSSEVSFTVVVVNQDSGDMGKYFVEGLAGINATKVLEESSVERAKENVSRGRAIAAIVIPEDFSANLLSGRKARVTVYVKDDPELMSVAVSLLRGYVSSFSEVYRSRSMEHLLGYLPSELADKIRASIETLVEPVELRVRQVGERPAMKGQWVSTMIVYTFLFSGMVSASASLAYEKISGNIRRIRASPASPWSILSGKVLGGLLMLSFSQAVLIAVTVLWLRPEVNWSWELAPLMLAGDMASMGLGLLVTEASPDPKAASEAVTAVAIILQFLCGIYFPLEFLPEPLRNIAELIPFNWANEALKGVLLRGYTLQDVAIPLIGLAAIAVIATGISSMLFPKWAEEA